MQFDKYKELVVTDKLYYNLVNEIDKFNDPDFQGFERLELIQRLKKVVAVSYVVIGLAGEVGEIAEKVKKTLRDDQGSFTDSKVEELGKEIGDVLWYEAALCDELELDFNDVACANVVKLSSRKERDKLSGGGDNR